MMDCRYLNELPTQTSENGSGVYAKMCLPPRDLSQFEIASDITARMTNGTSQFNSKLPTDQT
jgi:hypothetical protein